MNDLPSPKTLMTGLAFGESPRWHDGRLWFANWTTSEIVAVDEDGKSEVAVHLPFDEFPVSIDWLPDGRMLVVSRSHGLNVLQADGALQSYGDLSALAGMGWNEIVVDGRGNTYINGSSFDPATFTPGPGVIVLITPDGTARQVATGIAFPNGMTISSDNTALVIAESHGKKLTAFDVADDGGLSNQRTWAELGNDNPDGICFDAEGAVWYASVPGKHCVRVKEGGEVLQTISVDRGCFACMIGGEDRKTLFIMAAEWHGMDKMIGVPRTGRVLVSAVSVAGAGWPSAK